MLDVFSCPTVVVGRRVDGTKVVSSSVAVLAPLQRPPLHCSTTASTVNGRHVLQDDTHHRQPRSLSLSTRPSLILVLEDGCVQTQRRVRRRRSSSSHLFPVDVPSWEKRRYDGADKGPFVCSVADNNGATAQFICSDSVRRLITTSLGQQQRPAGLGRLKGLYICPVCQHRPVGSRRILFYIKASSFCQEMLGDVICNCWGCVEGIAKGWLPVAIVKEKQSSLLAARWDLSLRTFLTDPVGQLLLSCPLRKRKLLFVVVESESGQLHVHGFTSSSWCCSNYHVNFKRSQWICIPPISYTSNKTVIIILATS